MTLTPTKSTAAQIRAMMAVRERFIACASIRFLEIDEHGIGEQEGADHREEIDGVARVDDAAGDRREMGEEAERRDGRENRIRRPALEEAEHDRRAADGEEERGRA